MPPFWSCRCDALWDFTALHHECGLCGPHKIQDQGHGTVVAIVCGHCGRVCPIVGVPECGWRLNDTPSVGDPGCDPRETVQRAYDLVIDVCYAKVGNVDNPGCGMLVTVAVRIVDCVIDVFLL